MNERQKLAQQRSNTFVCIIRLRRFILHMALLQFLHFISCTDFCTAMLMLSQSEFYNDNFTNKLFDCCCFFVILVVKCQHKIHHRSLAHLSCIILSFVDQIDGQDDFACWFFLVPYSFFFFFFHSNRV